MPAQLFTLPALAAYLIFTADTEVGDPPDPDSSTYWEQREYYRDTEEQEGAFINAAVLAGYGIGLYAFSIVDSIFFSE